MATRPHRPATLEDVAKAAGVSRSTASRVMAGYGAASPAARTAVRSAAARLGYLPDQVAKALVSRTGVRLVVAVSGQTASVLDDPYIDRVVAAAAEVCGPRGVGVALHWLPLAAPRLDRLAEDRSVRGVLLVNTTERVLASVPAGLRGRVVSIGVGDRGVASFDIDNAGGAAAVVEHLYTSGRRRIAVLAGHSWLPCARRSITAYEELMTSAGLPARVVPGDFTAPSGRAGALEVLRRWPDTDAIFAVNDAMALGGLGVLRQRGVSVPGDIAVAGFDDIPFASLSAPALTTASHPVGHIARAAATAALDATPGPSTTMFASALIRRESA